MAILLVSAAFLLPFAAPFLVSMRIKDDYCGTKGLYYIYTMVEMGGVNGSILTSQTLPPCKEHVVFKLQCRCLRSRRRSC